MKQLLRAALVSGMVAGAASMMAEVPRHPLDGSTPNRIQHVTLDPSWRGSQLQFEVNRGQVDCEVEFLARTRYHTLFLTRAEAVVALGGETAPIRLHLIGANPQTELAGLEPLPGKLAYYRGTSPSSWQTDVSVYGKVRYSKVYPGVDLVYYGNDRQLECDFVVAPGVSPDVVRLSVDGVNGMHLDDAGNLVLETAKGQLVWSKPHLYQDVEGQRQAVEGEFIIRSGRELGFRVAPYDSRKPLVIDPTFVYSSYLGGSGEESGAILWPDASGNVYLFGQTESANFPNSTLGPGGDQDLFLTKLDANGSLVFSIRISAGAGPRRARRRSTPTEIFTWWARRRRPIFQC